MTSNNGLNLIIQESQNPNNPASVRCDASLLLMLLRLAETNNIFMPVDLSEMLGSVAARLKNVSAVIVGEKDGNGRVISLEEFEHRTHFLIQDANSIFDWLGEENCLILVNELAAEKTRILLIEGNVCEVCGYAETNDKEINVTLRRDGHCWAELKCLCDQCNRTLVKEPSVWGEVNDLILQINDMYISGREQPNNIGSIRRRFQDDQSIRDFFKMLQSESTSWSIPSLEKIAPWFDEKGRLIAT